MRSAIATLPWVETSTIKTDASKLQVKFTVKDAKQFKDEEVIAALKEKGSRYSSGAKKLTGPSEAKADEPKPN
ncbi:MAG: hypothetical protein MUF18_08135 [Fimbriiglobus sp.]|nr:hypothetical protein [Fimbriiglobus sp.]